MPVTVETLGKLIAEGRFLEARRKAEDDEQRSDDIQIKQLLGLSMAKSGAPKAALEILHPINQRYPHDPEVSGILGSIYKELFRQTRNMKYAVLSRDTYLNNFRLTGHHYTGINAASMHAITGSMSKAREIANEVISRLSASSTDAWEIASLAEAFLLIKKREKALELYLQSRPLVGTDWGKISSIYNQLWLLNHYIPVPSQVMNIFSPPAVVAFIGHMIDHPGRRRNRFPPSIETDVKQALTGAIQSVNARISYSSIACGSDILFAEAMIESGGEVNIFLPFDKEDFIKTSVAFAGEHWVKRFENLCENHQITFVTRERYLGQDDLFNFQSQVILGAAVQRAEMLHSSPHLITVFANMDKETLPGGTEDTLKLWPAGGKRININPQNFIKQSNPSTSAIHPDGSNYVPQDHKARCLRFLMLVTLPHAFSGSRDRFEYHKQKQIRELKVEEFNAGEDSIIFAFKTIEESVAMAWRFAKVPGLSHELTLSLHAGLVYGGPNGSLISGTATEIIREINGLTVPGKIYSSYQFATILALYSNKFSVEFAGIIPSANSETLSVFEINRHEDPFDL